jgi:hypothetical protein
MQSVTITENDNIKVDSHIVNPPNSVMWSERNKLVFFSLLCVI